MPRAPTIAAGLVQHRRRREARCRRRGRPAACSQARRRRTGAVGWNGLNADAPPVSASSRSAVWPSSVAAGQPSAGSGATNTKRPQLSVSNAMSAASVTSSRQRWRLSSNASRSTAPRVAPSSIGGGSIRSAAASGVPARRLATGCAGGREACAFVIASVGPLGGTQFEGSGIKGRLACEPIAACMPDGALRLTLNRPLRMVRPHGKTGGNEGGTRMSEALQQTIERLWETPRHAEPGDRRRAARGGRGRARRCSTTAAPASPNRPPAAGWSTSG